MAGGRAVCKAVGDTVLSVGFGVAHHVVYVVAISFSGFFADDHAAYTNVAVGSAFSVMIIW